MTPARRNKMSIVTLLIALVCFVAALLYATNEILHNGNAAAWTDGGLVAATVALLLHWWE